MCTPVNGRRIISQASRSSWRGAGLTLVAKTVAPILPFPINSCGRDAGEAGRAAVGDGQLAQGGTLARRWFACGRERVQRCGVRSVARINSQKKATCAMRASPFKWLSRQKVEDPISPGVLGERCSPTAQPFFFPSFPQRCPWARVSSPKY